MLPMIKPKKSNKLTKAEIQERIGYFTKRVFYWQRELGFLEVQMRVTAQDNHDTRASWFPDVSAGQISIHYSNHWIKDYKVFLEDIDRTAFHEVYESQFHKIQYYLLEVASTRIVSELLHIMTRRAENTIFPKLRGY